MRKSYLLYACLLIIICLSCQNNSTSEKHQKNRNIIVNVQDKVKEIQIDKDILIGSIVRLFIIDNYLMIYSFE